MPAAQYTGLIFIGLTILLTVGGQLLLKIGMTQAGGAPHDMRDIPIFILRAMLIPANFLGLASSFLAALCWMAALTKCKLSFAYPFTSLSIVLVLSLSSFLFGEKVLAQQWLGVSVVCMGLWVASQPA
jgi:drug/metabolite transporter (DMT)-like permease